MAEFKAPTAVGWAWIGATALAIAAVIILVVVILTPPSTQSTHSDSEQSPSPAASQAPVEVGELLDPGVADVGLIPQPLTDDPDAYVQAALLAPAIWNFAELPVDNNQTLRDGALMDWVADRGTGQEWVDSLISRFQNAYGAPLLNWSAQDAARDELAQSAEVVWIERGESCDLAPSCATYRWTVDTSTSWNDKITGEQIRVAGRYEGNIVLQCEASVPAAGSRHPGGDSCMIWNFNSSKVY